MQQEGGITGLRDSTRFDASCAHVKKRNASMMRFHAETHFPSGCRATFMLRFPCLRSKTNIDQGTQSQRTCMERWRDEYATDPQRMQAGDGVSGAWWE